MCDNKLSCRVICSKISARRCARPRLFPLSASGEKRGEAIYSADAPRFRLSVLHYSSAPPLLDRSSLPCNWGDRLEPIRDIDRKISKCNRNRNFFIVTSNCKILCNINTRIYKYKNIHGENIAVIITTKLCNVRPYRNFDLKY